MNHQSSFWDDAVFVQRDEVLECNEANIIAQDHKTVAKIRSWLRPTDFSCKGSEFQKHLSSHLPGTGTWALTSPVFQKWHGSSEHALLWVRGIPGSGKSVLAAKAVHELSQEHVPVLYFFFRQILDANCRPRAALQDWLAQVLPHSPLLQLELKHHVDKSDTSTKQLGQECELDSISMSDLWQHLRTALSHMSKAYLVVDALDEMDQGPQANSFLQSLSELACWKPSQVKILVTSRPVPNVERSFSKIAALQLKLDEEKVDQDIGVYVRTRLEQSQVSAEYYPLIQAVVPGRAKGLFLYAKLAMEALLKEGVHVRHALGQIPENLSQMYTQLLNQHAARSGVSIDEQRLILTWMTHSVRSLRLIELADILSSVTVPTNRDLATAKNVLRSACGSLLELSPDETLCVVHHSLTEFLTGKVLAASEGYPVLERESSHYRLALMCLGYLQNGCLEDVETQSSPRRGSFSPASAKALLAPFTEYAAINWSTHVLRSGEYGLAEMNSVLDQFTTHSHFQTWAHLAGLQTDAKSVTTPVSVAIDLGLSNYLRHLVARSDVDVDVNAGAPIVSAAARGFTDIVDLLIKSGANVDQYDARGRTALHRAAMNNHPAVVSLLLQAGCDIDLATKYSDADSAFTQSSSRASWFACTHGHTEVLAELQQYMKTPEQVEYALAVAIQHKRTELVRQLLVHPLIQLNSKAELAESTSVDSMSVDSDSFFDNRNVPLTLACDNRDSNIIELLLAAGADANNGALHALARSKATVDQVTTAKCFSLVIETGASLDAPDRGYHSGTPLHQAADAIAARLLLEAGANVEAQTRNGETALFTCKDAEALKVLVDVGGADLEKRNIDGRTPLLASIMHMSPSRHQDASEILALVDLGADVHAVDKEGNGVFHHAIDNLYAVFPNGLIERLCAAGADINKPNNRGEAPIHLTKIEIYKDFNNGSIQLPRRTTRFETLIAAGACLAPTPANDSRVPLFKWISESLCSASGSNLSDVMDVLVKCGASLDVVDDKGRTLLHDAVKGSRNKAQIRFLLDQGLDPHAVDHEGNTLWHDAASQLAGVLYRLEEKSAEPFAQLLQMGVDPVQPNHLGRIPLHVLSSLWPSAMREFQHGSRSSIRSGHTNRTTAFDMMLSLSPEVDIADKDGVTPLHLASTFCEYFVGELLSRGADPSRVTKEGCNAIHLAARANMSNIVGMLLFGLQSKLAPELMSAATARDCLGRAPLYYACLAGSYESAKFLIEAGATVDIDDYQVSPWRAIARFELESLNKSRSITDNSAGAVLIAHDSETADRREMYFGENRIDELVVLLLTNAGVSPSILDQTILDAASFKADYTVERVLEARGTAHFGEYNVENAHVVASVDRRQMQREDLGKPCKDCERVHYKSLLQVAVFMNDHRALPNVLAAEEDIAYRKSTLQRLVSGGYVSTLRQIVTNLGSQALHDRAQGERSEIQQRNTYRRPQDDEPLLLRACRRTVPNMDMIQALVEEAQYDINTQQQAEEAPNTYYHGYSDQGQYVQGECALHALVRSDHWWQANQGLRYFLERGANTELRDFLGMTPLSAALSRCGWLIFNKSAVELLVQCGADVNVVDRSGQSCLLKSCSNPEITRLLLDRGAVITQDVFIETLNAMNVDLLSLLLSRGGNPNTRGTPASEDSTTIFRNERYPLHFAIVEMSEYGHRNQSDQAKFTAMITLLLSYGANPCAAYESTTILHDLVRSETDIAPLFMSNKITFNIDVRNSRGETPLHLACRQSSRNQSSDDRQSAFKTLIAHGANIASCDDQGNTLWHVLSCTGAHGHKDRDLKALLDSEPGLINVPNKAGVTPLHNAMSNIKNSRMSEFLLTNGADVHSLDQNHNSMLHYLMRNEWAAHRPYEAWGKLVAVSTRLLAAGLNINNRNIDGETPIFTFFRHNSITQCCDKVGHAATTATVTARLGGGAEAESSASNTSCCIQPVYDLFTRTSGDWHAVNARGQNILHIIAGLSIITRQRKKQRSRDPRPSVLAERFRVLMEMGVDAALEDVEGRTPVDIAAAMDHREIMHLFRDAYE